MAIAGLQFTVTRRTERSVTVTADLIEKVRILDNVPLTFAPFDDKAFAEWLDSGRSEPPPILGSIMEFPVCCGRDARLRLLVVKPNELGKFDLQAVCMACGEQWVMKGCFVTGTRKESYVP